MDNVGNITISWKRRDRHAGNRVDYENFPLSETKEKWEVEINLLATTRIIESSNNKVVYLATD